MKPFSVISIGDLVADLTLSIPSLPVEAFKHQPAHHVRFEPGGAGNFLIAGARLGMQMIAVGALGDDPMGVTIVELLAREGVDAGGVLQHPGTTTTTVVVLVDEAGRHVFLGGYGSGPIVDLPESWIKSLDHAQAIFASGYTLREGRDAEACLQLMALANRNHVPVFFDPGPEMMHATPEQIASVLQTSDVILLTEEEIPLMGIAPGQEDARLLLEHRPGMVCVKRGGHGCTIYVKSADETPASVKTVSHLGFPVPVRDTTGAGDSFAAAFIYAYLSGWAIDEIAAFANAMGAAKVQKVGSGTQVPSADEVQAILHQFKVPIHWR